MNILIREKAADDLDSVFKRIAQDNPDAAARIIDPEAVRRALH